MILFLLEYATGSCSNDDIIDLSAFSFNNVSASKTNDAFVDLSGSTTKVDCAKVSEQVSIHHNNSKIKEYIDSVCMDMFSSYELKHLMDVCILS